MVDYSAVRVIGPSIAFFFAHLGSLLESIKGECLERISFFVGEDCPYTYVISSLFPLVSYSARVARSLKMSKVRSSDSVIRLFLFDDHEVSEATFVSTPTKPGTSRVPLPERTNSKSGIGFDSLILRKLGSPSDKERACHSYADKVCF